MDVATDCLEVFSVIAVVMVLFLKSSTSVIFRLRMLSLRLKIILTVVIPQCISRPCRIIDV